jgi:hypothetical protein
VLKGIQAVLATTIFLLFVFAPMQGQSGTVVLETANIFIGDTSQVPFAIALGFGYFFRQFWPFEVLRSRIFRIIFALTVFALILVSSPYCLLSFLLIPSLFLDIPAILQLSHSRITSILYLAGAMLSLFPVFFFTPFPAIVHIGLVAVLFGLSLYNKHLRDSLIQYIKRQELYEKDIATSDKRD